METIEERLSALERSNRRWRAYCGGLILLFGFVMLSAQVRQTDDINPPTAEMLLEKSFISKDVVTAGQFRLVDEDGQVRAVIGVKDSGDAGIYIFNEAGHSIARLSGRHHYPDLRLDGIQGNSASLNVVNNIPSLELNRMYGRGAGVWLAAEDPIPRLRLIDRLGRIVHRAPQIPSRPKR